MPDGDEEQRRREEREARAREWAQWLEESMRRRGVTPAQLATLSGDAIRLNTISQWRHGQIAPRNAETVVLVARLLGEPRVEALRAAGFDLTAQDIAALVRDAEGSGGALSAALGDRYVGEVDPEPENYEPTLEGVLAAIAGLGERMDRRFAAVHAKIDDVNADIDALAMTTGTLQREVRELSARFDRHAVRVDRRFDRVDAQFGQVRADIAALKTETALVESSVEGVAETVQRYLDDPHPHVGNVGVD